MHQLFRNAVFQRPPVVLGRQLKPFSLAHAMFLLACDSPYFHVGADPTIEDMAFLVWVCSQDAYPFGPIADAMLDDRTQKAMRKWGVQWSRKTRMTSMIEDSVKLTDYLISANDRPPRYFADGTQRNPKTPWPLTMVVKLMMNGTPVAQAWNQPMALSTSVKLTIDFLEGDDSLQSEREAAACVVVKEKEPEPEPDDG